MATAYITEINQPLGYPRTPVAEYPAETNQKVSFTTSTASAAFTSRTRILTIYCEDACYYEVGLNPTATTTASTYLPAGTVRDIGVTPGHKIAFVTAS